jgi:hypothetical protein
MMAARRQMRCTGLPVSGVIEMIKSLLFDIVMVSPDCRCEGPSRLSLRGAFFATKQSNAFHCCECCVRGNLIGIASLRSQ